MHNLQRFLRPNVVLQQPQEVIASTRITGEDGNPIPWRIVPIDGREDSILREGCMRWLPANGKEQAVYALDRNQYFLALAVRCTEYPDLNSIELQDSYGILGAEALLQSMLNPGEYADYLAAVQNICGYGVKIEAEMEECAKN